jgi:uncharacterized membrane protein
MSMTYERHQPRPPLVSDENFVVGVYVLYALGYFTLITALIGVIIAHSKVNHADEMMRSHYQYQIRTFWIGLLYNLIGVPLCLVLVGFPIMLWWFIWSLIRIIKGFTLIADNKPIDHPQSWLFG